VFPHESPTMLPPGLSTQAATLVLPQNGGLLTWAAKPSVSESPDPASSMARLSSPLAELHGVVRHLRYAAAAPEVPLLAICNDIFFDVPSFLPIARYSGALVQNKEHLRHVLWGLLLELPGFGNRFRELAARRTRMMRCLPTSVPSLVTGVRLAGKSNLGVINPGHISEEALPCVKASDRTTRSA
jgi:hypothetical protein